MATRAIYLKLTYDSILRRIPGIRGEMAMSRVIYGFAYIFMVCNRPCVDMQGLIKALFRP